MPRKQRAKHQAVEIDHWEWRRTLKLPMILALLLLVVEIGLGNVSFWQSLTFPSERSIVPEYGPGIEDLGEGRIKITGVEAADNWLLLSDINEHVGSVNIGISREMSDGDMRINEVNVQLSATDAGNVNGFTMYPTTISTLYPDTSRVHVHLNGVTQWIRIQINEPVGTELRIGDLIVNDRSPFRVKPWRLVLEFVVAGLIILFRPHSWVWRASWRERSVRSCAVIGGVMLLSFIALIYSMQARSPWTEISELHEPSVLTIYQSQTDAILSGQPWLQEKPPAWLSEVENPYDPTVRGDRDPIIFDYAYFEGRYWSYYGVLPVFLLFLPFKLLTGQDLATWPCVLLCLAALIPAGWWLIRSVCRRYVPESSLGSTALLLLVFPALTYTVVLSADGRTYALPFALGVLLAICAIASWITACRDDGTVSVPWVAVGSLLMGLEVGTRPLFALGALLAIPIFWEPLRAGEMKIRQWCSLILSATGGAIPFLVWNHIRFGNWLDFGASYNLTVVDMMHQSGGLHRLPVAVSEMLLQPVPINFQWPFIFPDVTKVTGYQGQMASYGTSGGYFSLVPIAVVGMLGVLCFTSARRRLRGLSTVCLACAAILFVFDVMVGGMNPRYTNDFAWLLAIAAIAGISVLDEETHRISRPGFAALYRTVVLVASLATMVLMYWNVVCLSDGGNLHTELFQWQVKQALMPL